MPHRGTGSLKSQMGSCFMESALDDPVRVPLKLLLWAPKGAGRHYGGPGTAAYAVLSSRKRGDLIVDLAHGYPPQEQYDVFQRQWPIGDVRTFWSRQMFTRRGVHWVAAHASQYDVFFGLMAFDFTVLPALKAEALGVPAVVKIVNYRGDLADKGLIKSLYGAPRRRRLGIRQISAVVAISDGIRQELLEYGVDEARIACIPNGVDTDRFSPCSSAEEKKSIRQELGLADEPTVVFVGALVPRKQPHLVIDAVRLLKAQGTRIQVLLVGPAPDAKYLSRLKGLVHEASLADQVRFLGFIQDCSQAYRAADYFVLPSLREGMPNSLLEAMSCGLECICLPIPGVVDVIANGVHGWLIDGSAAELAAMLGDSLRTRLPILGGEARKRVTESYSAKAVYSSYLRLFQRLRS